MHPHKKFKFVFKPLRQKDYKVPEKYFERSSSFMTIFVSFSLLTIITYITLFSYLSFRYHFILILLFPFVSFLFINLLFILFNPLVLIFDDQMEIRLFLFLKKVFYFRDIKTVDVKKKSMTIVYHDGEFEKIPFFPIRTSSIEELKKEIFKKIWESVS